MGQKLVNLPVSHCLISSHFALTFINAGNQSKADVRYGTFDSSVVEVAQADLNTFLQALCQ